MTKQQQRQQAYQARNEQPNKASISRIITEKFFNHPLYQQANTVMCYLHCRSEVQTLARIKTALSQSKKIVIPYCTKDYDGQPKLGLWHLEDLSELVAGTWGILEPSPLQWGKKEVLPEALDLIMVPGVAFDSVGGRLGNGAGYYDRLFNTIRSDTSLIAIAYQAQVFPHVIMETHDVYMDSVLTEENSYTRRVDGFKPR